jgi:serine phosphatase RsbU (regulator of sigma subunit)
VRNGEMTEYKASKMPVGIYVKENDFANNDIQLERGDMLYIFSDGYADQFGGTDGSKYMSKTFKRLLVSISSLPLDDQKEQLGQAHDEWRGDGSQVDDLLVMGIRI